MLLSDGGPPCQLDGDGGHGALHGLKGLWGRGLTSHLEEKTHRLFSRKVAFLAQLASSPSTSRHSGKLGKKEKK